MSSDPVTDRLTGASTNFGVNEKLLVDDRLVLSRHQESASEVSGRGIFARGVNKSFIEHGREVMALDDVSLSIPAGQFLSLVGPSGCGKTTLLRIIAGLEKPSAGTVEWNFEEIKRSRFSVVFQQNGVFPWMTVLDNACFGLVVQGMPKKLAESTARKYLIDLGLEGFENMYPRQLSGGMNQRVALARAFSDDSEALLMDEPMAALDEQTKMLVQDDLLRLWHKNHKTVLFITHSLDEAIVLGDAVAVMSRRPGRIKCVIPVDLDRPRDALEIRNDEKFLAIRREIWQMLRDEFVN